MKLKYLFRVTFFIFKYNIFYRKRKIKNNKNKFYTFMNLQAPCTNILFQSKTFIKN